MPMQVHICPADSRSLGFLHCFTSSQFMSLFVDSPEGLDPVHVPHLGRILHNVCPIVWPLWDCKAIQYIVCGGSKTRKLMFSYHQEWWEPRDLLKRTKY